MTNGNGASVDTGPELTPAEEAEHRRRLAVTYADQADAEVAAIEEKMTGWKRALVEKKSEAKTLRAAAEKASN